MGVKKLLKSFDYVLLILVIALFAIGIIAISSATNVHMNGLTRQFKIQMISFGIGLAIIVIMQFFDYEIFRALYKPIYVFGILLLLILYIPGVGASRGNAVSWIDLGIIDFQTSEVAKLCYIIFYAKFLENRKGIETFKDLCIAVLPLLPFLALLLAQPDLGTALVFVVSTFCMMFVAGLKYRHIFAGLVSAVLLMPLIYPRLKPHQQQRIDSFLNPNDPTLPGYYQVQQSKITIGSGQMNGKGLFQGVYHRYDYLPVQESDFIFAVWVEETGFTGGLLLIGLFAAFLIRMIYLSTKVKDDFSIYLIIGIVGMFSFQIIENIGMTVGLLPVTGVTLPFISYGGSSLITCMVAIGLVEMVYTRRKRGNFMK